MNKNDLSSFLKGFQLPKIVSNLKCAVKNHSLKLVKLNLQALRYSTQKHQKDKGKVIHCNYLMKYYEI